jgi:hypothetical protein
MSLSKNCAELVFKNSKYLLCSFKRTSLAHSVNDLKKINLVIQQFFIF